MKTILKVHHDVMTVPSIINVMIKNYKDIGYNVEKITSNNFKIIFPDGIVYIYWENGIIYQEIKQ